MRALLSLITLLSVTTRADVPRPVARPIQPDVQCALWADGLPRTSDNVRMVTSRLRFERNIEHGERCLTGHCLATWKFEYSGFKLGIYRIERVATGESEQRTYVFGLVAEKNGVRVQDVSVRAFTNRGSDVGQINFNALLGDEIVTVWCSNLEE